jgi:hypothetical protein
MQDKVLIPAIIVMLLVSLWLALRIWYINQRSALTPSERAAEDAAQDHEQVW